MKVLVVDDSATVRLQLRGLFEERGVVDVREAASAKEGIAAYLAERPDVVFLDLMMPETSGIGMLDELFRHDPRARVVLLTAVEPDSEAVTAAIAAGAVDYLAKPLRRETLARVLRDLEREGAAPKTDKVEGYG